MNTKEKAISYFRSGYNCSQSVLMACTGEIQVSSKIAAAFGGGMGRMQKTCGAVTGAYIWLGMAHGKEGMSVGEHKAGVYAKVQEFNRIFVARNGSDLCLELLGEDLSTPAGNASIAQNDLTEKVCEKCITDAIEIIETLGAG